jgi:hypothetical protein
MSPREAQEIYYESDEESSCTVFPMKRSVSFGEIEIREYNRIVGDSNANILVGPPVSIGWDFVQQDAVELETFERHRAVHRRKAALKMCHMQRSELLRNVFLVPASEIRAVEKEIQQMRKEARTQAKNKQEKRKKKAAEKIKADGAATSVATATPTKASFGLFRGLGKSARRPGSVVAQ